MNIALLVLVLALLWCAATGSFTGPTLVFGAVIAALALWVVRFYVRGLGYLARLIRIIALIWLFIRELILSAIRVAILVMRPDMNERLRPEIIAFPLTVTRDAEITLLANLITLTPGTLSVDVSEDRKTLYVHALTVPDREALIAEIRDGFESAVARAFE